MHLDKKKKKILKMYMESFQGNWQQFKRIGCKGQCKISANIQSGR